MSEDKQKTTGEMLDETIQKEIEHATKKLEEYYKEKFSKGKGKTINNKIHCTLCTQDFVIKQKNNKDVTESKQICPHIIFKSWEVKH